MPTDFRERAERVVFGRVLLGQGGTIKGIQERCIAELQAVHDEARREGSEWMREAVIVAFALPDGTADPDPEMNSAILSALKDFLIDAQAVVRALPAEPETGGSDV